MSLCKENSYEAIDTTPLDLELDAAAPQSLQARSHWAGRARSLGVGVMLAGAVCGTYYGLTARENATSHREYIRGSHPAFVNLNTVPVETGGDNLCNEEHVQKVCDQFYHEAAPLWSSKDLQPRFVHAVEIARGLAVDKQSVIDLLTTLEIEDQTLGPKFAFTCQELCERLVGSFPPGTVPSKSDVGCYTVDVVTTCDVDVGEATMSKIKFGIPTAAKENGFGESAAEEKKFHMTTGSEVDEEEKMIRSALTIGHKQSDREKKLMYDLNHKKMDFRELRLMLVNLFGIYPTTTDVTTGTGELDLGVVAPQRRLSDAWKAVAEATAIRAKAAVAMTLQRMEALEVSALVIKWFGNNLEDPTRDNIKRVLTGVTSMLNNVEYVYPGPECTANMYAYVYPQSPWNKNRWTGQFIFYLCDLYMNSSPDYQVEVLVHEGSHHTSMTTDDSKTASGQTMYGRSICSVVASGCAAGDAADCSRSIVNADTFEYFVADAITDQVVPAPAAAPAATATAAAAGGGLFGSLR